MAQNGRFYTRTRRIPVTVGRLPSGERIPGGPYTGVQFTGAVLAGALLLATQWLWGTGTGLVDLAVGLGISYGVVLLLKQAPESLHEVRLNASGVLRVAFTPSSGTYRGRPVAARPRRPRRDGSASGGGAHPVDREEMTEAPARGAVPVRRAPVALGESSVTRLLRDAGQCAENDLGKGAGCA